jgi:NCAIR mutase (PurE)-related protein
MKEVSGGGVAGFVGGKGMGIDALFAGPFHPDYNEVDNTLKQQLKDRKKQRADMEKETDDYTGTPDPVGGYYETDTEFVELAYKELETRNQTTIDYNIENTPEQDLEWVEVETDLEYDEAGEAYKIKDIVYDDEPTYAGVNFINQSQTNWEIIDRG